MNNADPSPNRARRERTPEEQAEWESFLSNSGHGSYGDFYERASTRRNRARAYVAQAAFAPQVEIALAAPQDIVTLTTEENIAVQALQSQLTSSGAGVQ